MIVKCLNLSLGLLVSLQEMCALDPEVLRILAESVDVVLSCPDLGIYVGYSGS